MEKTDLYKSPDGLTKQREALPQSFLGQIEDTKDEIISFLKAPSRNLDYKKVTNNLVLGLKNYLLESKQKGYVVGVSGGIDSALVSTLCAMTGEKVIVLDLPIHQKGDEIDRGQEHINWLKNNFQNVRSFSINLTNTYESLKQSLPEVNDETIRYMAYVNARSRLRAVTLYTIGNEHSCLVAGTGNKIEDYGIGFFTKFGDGAVDISPIGELYKSEVYEMAKYLGISESILKARPTDGLHPNGATDEDQIGAKYDELEWAMVQHEEGKTISDFTGRAQEVMKIYTQRHLVNAHKMKMPPILPLD